MNVSVEHDRHFIYAEDIGCKITDATPTDMGWGRWVYGRSGKPLVYPNLGVWLTAVRLTNFAYEDEIQAFPGERYRLVCRGSASCASLWEVEKR